jgi:hypothetical protein
MGVALPEPACPTRNKMRITSGVRDKDPPSQHPVLGVLFRNGVAPPHNCRNAQWPSFGGKRDYQRNCQNHVVCG